MLRLQRSQEVTGPPHPLGTEQSSPPLPPSAQIPTPSTLTTAPDATRDEMSSITLSSASIISSSQVIEIFVGGLDAKHDTKYMKAHLL